MVLRSLRRIAALCTVLALAWPAAAVAAPPAQGRASAEATAAQARGRFAAQDYEGAARLFMQAYAKSHEPALVFNAARAYEQAGMARDAVALFRLYLTLATDGEGKADAQERVQRLEAGTHADATPHASAVALPAGVTAADSPAAPDWHVWAEAGGAAALLGTGAALMLVGRSASVDANAAPVNSARDFPAYHDRFATARAQWWTGVGLCAAGAGVAAWAGWTWHARPAPTVAIVPAGAGLAVSGGF